MQQLCDQQEAEQRERQEKLKQELAEAQERISLLDKLVVRLYEDLTAGRIAEGNFQSVMANTQQEQRERREQTETLNRALKENENAPGNAEAWVSLISEYANVKALDAEMLNRLLKEIVVHERIDEAGKRHLTVELHFNFRPLPTLAKVAG